MSGTFKILRFQPVALTLDRIGPFQDFIMEFDFLSADKTEPCNMYLIIGKNGTGKTTVINVMTHLMKIILMDPDKQLSFEYEPFNQGGRAQWDIWMEYEHGGKNHQILLSLAAGEGDAWGLKGWEPDKLIELGFEDREFLAIHREGGFLKRTVSGEVVELFCKSIKTGQNIRKKRLEDIQCHLPTLLSFSAHRDIPPISPSSRRAIDVPDFWEYSSLKTFAVDGHEWAQSIDNLLVWLLWLGDTDFNQAKEFINQTVFERSSSKRLERIQKIPPEAVILANGREHSLASLSGGERSLFQIMARIMANMTANTILIVDELDVHLHPDWEHFVIGTFKRLVQKHPRFTFILTTHSGLLVNAFDMGCEEEHLVKGGHSIDEISV